MTDTLSMLQKLHDTLSLTPKELPALIYERHRIICKAGHECPGVNETIAFQRPSWLKDEWKGLVKYLSCAYKGTEDRRESCDMPHIVNDAAGDLVCVCGNRDCLQPSEVVKVLDEEKNIVVRRPRLLFLVRTLPRLDGGIQYDYHLRPFPQSVFERRLKRPTSEES